MRRNTAAGVARREGNSVAHVRLSGVGMADSSHRRRSRALGGAKGPGGGAGAGGGNGHGNGPSGSGNGHGSGRPKPGKAWHPARACPDLVTFLTYLDGRLPHLLQQRVHTHVWQCASCFKVFTSCMNELLEPGEDPAGTADPGDSWIAAAVKRIEREVGAELAAMAAQPAWEGEPELEGDSPDPAWLIEPEEMQPDQAWSPKHADPRLEAARSVLPVRLHARRIPHGVALRIPVALTVVVLFTLGFWVSSRRPQDGARSAPNTYALDSARSTEELVASIQRGIATLRRAVAAKPRSPALLNDLGGALLTRVELSDRRRGDGESGSSWGSDMFGDVHDADLVAALEAIDRALEISPRLKEALFNRALALERLHLPHTARKAWQAYLEVDDSSPWAREARQRMEAIVVPVRPDPVRLRAEIAAAASSGEGRQLAALVMRHRELARRTMQEELLPGWAEAWIAGDHHRAERLLDAAGALAIEWESQTADRTLRSAVIEIETSDHDVRARLATGYRAFGEASRALDALEPGSADRAAEHALAALPPASPAATWAGLVRLSCAFYRNDDLRRDALRLVDKADGDLASEARARWILGLWHGRRGHLATSLSYLGRSLDAYDRLDARDSRTWLHHLVADAYGYMGATGASWSHRRRALQHAHLLTGNQRGLSVMIDSAMLALAEGRPHVAADLLDEGLSEPDSERPGEIAQACLLRSRVLRELGKTAEARREYLRAEAWLVRAQPLDRQFLNGDLNLVAGLLENDPHRAVDRISRALDRFRKFGPPLRLPGVLLARARAHLRSGDVEAADADLRQGLVVLQQQAGRAGEVWIRRLDGPESLFDERIELAIRAGDAGAAFAVAEASHAYSMQTLATHSSRAADRFESAAYPEHLQSQLPHGTTLLCYSWLADRVVLWRFGRDGWQLVTLTTQPGELSALVAAFGSDLAARDWTAATRDAAMRLYTALVPHDKLASGPIVVVPDGPLHSLPFAALVNPESGRFLLEDHEITIAASAGAVLRRQAFAETPPGPPRDALVVGDPRLDPRLLPAVPPLPGARDEAQEIAALYEERDLLLGGLATRAAVLHALGRRAVLHFSGHALPNRVDPGLSVLPLADDPETTEELLVASDIASLDLSGTRIVVLSGCETGVGEDGGSGPLSLARAFLVAGVPDVVASLWPIADAPSAPLMTAFHRRLLSGERPATALRGAQLELLRGKQPILRSPGVWAAFEAFTG